AGSQFTKGSIRNYGNVITGEGPLPEAAQVRATDHFRERTRAIVTRERDTHVEAPTGSFNIERDPVSDLMPANVEAPPSGLQMMNGAGRLGAPGLLPAGGIPTPSPSPDLLPGIHNGRPPPRPRGPTVDPMPTGPTLR